MTIPKLMEKKRQGQKITMLTAYDYLTASILDEAGIDVLLVGDSLGMVMLGYPNTLPVTMEQMLHHTRAVASGCKNALVVGDMPFMSFQVSVTETIHNAGRFIKEAGAQAVKLEWVPDAPEKTRALTDAGISVMGHVGLTPQAVYQMGGFKVQGREADAARRLVEESQRLEEAGAFAIVLEAIPPQLAKEITGKLTIPTFGIGAGMDCDGQVLVTHDMVGLTGGKPPKFVKQYAQLRPELIKAVQEYKQDVEAGRFPSEEFTYK